MNTHAIKNAATFMIFLVFTIPFLSAQAFASHVTYSVNSNGVRDYRNTQDTTTVVAEIPESGVAASDVRLVTQKSTPFTSCTPATGKTVCTYQYAPGTWKAGKWDYSVSYKGHSAANSIIVDSYVPNVTINSIVSGKDLRVDFSVKERAYSPTQSLCAGIKTVNFVLGGGTVRSLALNFTPGTNCDYQRLINMTALSTQGVEKEFCVEVVDNVLNVGRSCRTLLVDKEAPVTTDVKIFDSQNQEITYISPKTGPLKATLRFTLTERSSLANIVADASEFATSPTQKAAQKAVNVVCTKASSAAYDCRVPITLGLPQGGSPVLRLRATDSSDNVADLQLPVSVQLDADSPKVTSLFARQCGEQNALGPVNNTVVATINEAGSGLGARKVYLDLSAALGPQYGRTYATDCSQAGNNWICKWGPINVPVGQGPAHGSKPPIQIVSPSQDNAGNFFETITPNFFYDSEKPVLLNHTLFASSSASFGEELTEYPTGGGTIELKVLVKDDLPVFMTADFSNVAHVQKRTVACAPEGDHQVCIFSLIGPLYNGPIFDAAIPLTITDCVGNSISSEIKMDISVIESATQNYWDYTVTGRMPDKIDKQTIAVFPNRVYFPIALTGSPLVTPIVQQLVRCEGENGYLDYNLQDQRLPDVLNRPSISPYAKFNLQRGISPPDSTTYTCTFRTISRSQNGIISQPEYDNVTFTLLFYNSPLGTIDKALQDKLDGVKNSPLVKGEWIGKMQKIIGIANNLCNIYGLIAGVATTLSAIHIAMGVFEKIPFTTAIAKAIGQAANAISIADTSLGKLVGEMCAWISCKKVPLQKVKEVIDNIQSGEIIGLNLEKATGLQGKLDPKNSLLISVGTLCFPGILVNLQKARAIECSYIYCIKTQVSQGVPPYFCDVQRASAWCKYVWGEIFQLIPFARFLDKIVDVAKKIVSDPLFLLAVAIQLCISYTEGVLQGSCKLVKHTGELVSIIVDLVDADTWNNAFSPPGGDICEEALKD